MNYHSASPRRGFTMIELLIVMGIIGIIATLSMGRMSRQITAWRVNAAAQAFQNDLQSAFAIVGRNRKPLVVTMDTAKMQLRLISRSGVDTFRLRAFGASSTYRLTGSDMTVYPATLRLEIYPPGLASDSLSILIKKDGTGRRIRMLRGGLVQICKTGATNKC